MAEEYCGDNRESSERPTGKFGCRVGMIMCGESSRSPDQSDPTATGKRPGDAVCADRYADSIN